MSAPSRTSRARSKQSSASSGAVERPEGELKSAHAPHPCVASQRKLDFCPADVFAANCFRAPLRSSWAAAAAAPTCDQPSAAHELDARPSPTGSKSHHSASPDPQKANTTDKRDVQAATNSDDAAMMSQLAGATGGPAATQHALNGTSQSARREDGGPDDDGQSSSLSEIEDGPEDDVSEEEPQHLGGGINDSEAETERLENSPHKFRKHKAVVLGLGSSHTFERSPSKLDTQTKIEIDSPAPDATLKGEEDDASTSGASKSNGDMEPNTAATSLEDSAGEGMKAPSPPETVGKKRKRASTGSRGAGEGIDDDEPAAKKTGSVKDGINGSGAGLRRSGARPSPEAGENARNVSGDDEILSEEMDVDKDERSAKEADDAESRVASPLKSTKGKKGRRKVAKARLVDQDADMAIDDDEKATGADENFAEEAILDDAVEADGEAGEAEAVARNEEELLKKRSAMDSLGTIEKHFATFRDRLYDERMGQLTNELALLNQPESTHPELLAMLQCIDARRDEKIQLENTVLQYKLKALQMKCVAERSQMHSQYFQTVRAVREKKLEEVGEQWYQIQRDRRGWDGSVPDFTHKFPTRRSQQITHQTAYNLEVSILAGVAKYVGFPAAPPIEGARPSEILEDFQAMGVGTPPHFKDRPLTPSPSQIKPQSRAAVNPTPPLRSSLSVPSISGPNPAAEEQFIEQTPWANPRHPAHQLPRQRQPSQQTTARTGSPFAVPAVQRRKEVGEAAQEHQLAVDGPVTTSRFSQLSEMSAV
ncbi:MAG: hypothetical protein M1832_002061 [Thelocarpon impressellum]|nr:MAG: hypothetical protein M1832_002061 [Thelocarpon impressellum]